MKSFLEPFKDSLIFKILLAIIMFLFTWISNGQVDRTSELYRTLKGKDSIIFERAFNRCELDKLEPIIAINFEFYHDIAGIQETSAASSQKNI